MKYIEVDLDQAIRDLHEKLIGGFATPEFSHNGTTIAAARSLLEVISHVLYDCVLLASNRNKQNARKKWKLLVGRFSKSQLLGLTIAMFSPKNARQVMAKFLGEDAQSESQIRRHRDLLAALGCFTFEKMQMVKDQIGRFIPGTNLGKKSCGLLRKVNMTKLLLIASTLIQYLSGAHGGLEAYMPPHRFACLAMLWNKVIGKGSIFSPLSKDILTEGERRTQAYISAGHLLAAIEEQQNLIDKLAKSGIKPSKQTIEHLRSLRRSLASIEQAHHAWTHEFDTEDLPF